MRLKNIIGYNSWNAPPSLSSKPAKSLQKTLSVIFLAYLSLSGTITFLKRKRCFFFLELDRFSTKVDDITLPLKWDASRVHTSFSMTCFIAKYLIIRELTYCVGGSKVELMIFLWPEPNTLLLVSWFGFRTRAINALRTVSMNRLPALEVVPFSCLWLSKSHSWPKKSLVLSRSSSQSECNNDDRVRSYSWKHRINNL